MLGWDEVVALDREGTLAFEAHTVTHPNLLLRSTSGARAEIARLEGASSRTGSAGGSRPSPIRPGSSASANAGSSRSRATPPRCRASRASTSRATDRLALRRRQIDARDRLLDFQAKLGGGHDTPLPLRDTYRRLRYGEVPFPASELAG